MFCTHCDRDLPTFRFCPICGNPPAPQVNVNQPDETQIYGSPQNSPQGQPSSNNYYNNNYQNNPNYTPIHGEKSGGLAIVLSFLIMGVGQMYAGKIGRGVGILIGGIILGIVLLIVTVIAGMNSYSYQSANDVLAITIIMSLALLIIWIWQIIDAHRLCGKYNQYLLQNGQPPW